MPYLATFGLEFENTIYCHIWNQRLRIFLIAKFREIIKIPPQKIKMSKFGTQNALFRYFWAGILKSLLSNLKSTPPNLSKMDF